MSPSKAEKIVNDLLSDLREFHLLLENLNSFYSMNKYLCKKIVSAGIITNVVSPQSSSSPYEIHFETDEGQSSIKVQENFIEKHQPKIGLYLVRYEDGYLSISPKEVFEAGYNKLFASLTLQDDDQLITSIAKICHQANKAYCESIGDTSQVEWEDAPEWQKNSAILGVRFSINNLDKPISANHESWLKVKIDEGWVYGEIKDAEAKTHPCIVPYSQLPEAQKRKDAIFRNIVSSFCISI